jgi:tRNA (guanine-N7-)-methyltransferase
MDQPESLPEPSSRYGINPRDRGLEPIDLEAEFGSRRPVILEIGSGKGRFLVESAIEHPELSFIGVEMALAYFRVVRKRIEKRELDNARVINYDARAVVSRMLGDASIREIHIYFPDPWPKKKKRKRRFVQDGVLEQLDRILEPDGQGFFVTDHEEYFHSSVPLFERWFEIEAGEITDREPRTNYEAKYREEGRPIYEIRFRKRQ